jgi:hypothetical protein
MLLYLTNTHPSYGVPALSLSHAELVSREMREIARNIIETELNKLHLPTPSDSAMEEHIDKLIQVKNLEILNEAELRVKNRRDVFTESMAAMAPPKVFDAI